MRCGETVLAEQVGALLAALGGGSSDGVRVAVTAGGFEYSMRAMFAGAQPLRTPIQGNTSVTVV